MSTQAETFALFAPGESLTMAQCDYARGKCKTIAVSDAYQLAPWADVLVATDAMWWKSRPGAKLFPGLKFTTNPNVDYAELVPAYDSFINRGSNSGVLAMYVARMLGAKRMLLIGYDMHGTHFFGPHTGDLANTNAKRYEVFQTYFDRMKIMLDREGIEVLNCTKGSKLRGFKMAKIEECL